MTKSILVTGGAGYIGSHTCLALLEAGYTVTVLDNYCNSQAESLNRVEQIAGKELTRIEGDVRDSSAIVHAIRQNGATAVIHFAGIKAVGDSVCQPLQYYDNNVVGALRLLEAMAQCDVRTLVFSSSATVYGNPQHLPISENHPLAPTSPYGRTKWVAEHLLRDAFAADTTLRIGMLRYFNPIGAHTSGLIGEDPKGVPNNLLPFVAQVALGQREFLNVWGSDYDTPDGTGVRDYIHVMDLACGHLRLLEALNGADAGQCSAINLGTGVGYSVRDVVRAFEQVSGKSIACRLQQRRPGDVAICYADPTLALRVLGWSAPRDIHTMCADVWRWHMNNPQGYDSMA